LGKKYYIVGYLINGKLTTDTCSGTEGLERASKNLDKLNTRSKKEKVRISSVPRI